MSNSKDASDNIKKRQRSADEQKSSRVVRARVAKPPPTHADLVAGGFFRASRDEKLCSGASCVVLYNSDICTV